MNKRMACLIIGLLALLLVSNHVASASSTPSWQILPQTPLINGYGQADAGSAVVGGDLYMIDGYGNTVSDVLNTVSIFHTSNDSWSSGPSAPFKVWNLACASYLNKTIYCFYPGDDVFSYNTTTSQWSVLKASVPIDLGIGLGAVVYGDGVYLIGGYFPDSGTDYTTNSVYRFSITNSTFTLLAPLLTELSGAVYSLYDGQIYVLGGYSHGYAIDSAEVYNISANSWSYLETKTPTQMFGMGREASAIDGLIPVVDGKSTYDQFFNTFYLYNITSNSWITMPSTNFARDGVSFWVLGDKIFVGDGRNSYYTPQGLPYLEEIDLTPPTSETTTTTLSANLTAASTANSSTTSTMTFPPVTVTQTETMTQTVTTVATTTATATETDTETFTSTWTSTATQTSTITAIKMTTTTSTVLIPTSLSLSCDKSVHVDQGANCKATVTSSTGGLTGRVVFTSRGPGAGKFGNVTCNGPTGSARNPLVCMVKYTPSTNGTKTITAAYLGDTYHSKCRGTFQIRVINKSGKNNDGIIVRPQLSAEGPLIALAASGTNSATLLNIRVAATWPSMWQVTRKIA